MFLALTQWCVNTRKMLHFITWYAPKLYPFHNDPFISYVNTGQIHLMLKQSGLMLTTVQHDTILHETQQWQLNLNPHKICDMYTDGFVQDSSISIANALETLQSCTKQLLYIAMGCLLWVIVQNWLCYNGTTLYKPFFFYWLLAWMSL